MSHKVNLFEVWTERVNGKLVQRSASLGVVAIDNEKNKERRKDSARVKALSHVGRAPSTIHHSLNESIVVTFRRATALSNNSPEVDNA